MTHEETERINRRDAEKINAAADCFNAEMMDVLWYQTVFCDADQYDDLLKVLIKAPVSDPDIER